jgi:hypothetical protein
MMTEAQRHLLEEFNAGEPNWHERINTTRRLVKWIQQVTDRQAQPEASRLYYYEHLLMMGKSSPDRRRLH